MKIVYIAESIIPSQTANSVHVMKMCQAFNSNGHEVVLLVPNIIDKNIKTDNVHDFYGVKDCFRVIKLPFPGTKFSFLIFSLLSVIRAKKAQPQLVYTRFLYSAFVSLLFGLPTVYEIHASFKKKLEKMIFCLMNKSKLKKIIVITKSLNDHFVDKYNIDKYKIFIAPDGADPVDPGLGLKKINKDNQEVIIGYIGNLYKGRGIDVIARLAEKCPWAEFHIIGGYPKDLEYWRSELSDLKNIIFYGFLPHRDVSKYMLSFDALIAPYQKNATIQGQGNISQWMSPLKIFEYMAAGKAILSSDLPALKEVLVHGRNSLLASPGDINAWVSNLELIRNDIQLRANLGKNARKDFEEYYTWKSRAKNILNSFNY